MKDRVKAPLNHSKMERMLLNGEMKSKIKQVAAETRKTHNKIDTIDSKTEENKNKRKTYIYNSINSDEIMIAILNLKQREYIYYNTI